MIVEQVARMSAATSGTTLTPPPDIAALIGATLVYQAHQKTLNTFAPAKCTNHIRRAGYGTPPGSNADRSGEVFLRSLQ